MNVSSSPSVSPRVNSMPSSVRAANSCTMPSSAFCMLARFGSTSPFMHSSPSGALRRTTPSCSSAPASSVT